MQFSHADDDDIRMQFFKVIYDICLLAWSHCINTESNCYVELSGVYQMTQFKGTPHSPTLYVIKHVTYTSKSLQHSGSSTYQITF